MDFPFAGVAEIRDAISRREAGASDVARAICDRAASADRELGAYVLFDRGGALSRARSVDAALLRKEAPGRLAGALVAVKDNILTRDMQTTAGSRLLGGFRPVYSAHAVSLLEEAGGIVAGKTNLDEFGMGSSTELSVHGPTRNPWDPTRVPGGSSGGSAAAVAAGMCTVALGSDTGGSIRQPAALCGVVGLCPTYGLVSRRGLVAFASSLDRIGPLGRTVRDVAEVLCVIAGHDPGDSTCAGRPVPDYLQHIEDGVQGARVGVPRAWLGAGLCPEVRERVEEALAELERAGAELVGVELPDPRHCLAAYHVIAPAEASSNLARYDGMRFGLRAVPSPPPRVGLGPEPWGVGGGVPPGRHPAAQNPAPSSRGRRGGGFRAAADGLVPTYEATRGGGFGPEVKRRILLGTFVLSAGYRDAYYETALRARVAIRLGFERALASCDVIATPTSPVTAWRLGERLGDPLSMYAMDVYTVGSSLAGLPAASVPCGFAAGLPVGLQLIGRPFGEADLLRVARAYEVRAPWHERRPGEGSHE